jgi:hypothetical protein
LGHVRKVCRAVRHAPAMNVRRRRSVVVMWSVVVIVAFSLILLGILRILSPRSTEYHMRSFVYHSSAMPPQVHSWRDRFTREYFRWILSGRPTSGEHTYLAREHERVLLERGAFERKEFVLQHRPPSKRTLIEIAALLKRHCTDRLCSMHFDERNPLRFNIYTTPGNMRLVEAAIQEYDESGKHTSPTAQPNGAANRSQPIRAETNRTSVAAGSDR